MLRGSLFLLLSGVYVPEERFEKMEDLAVSESKSLFPISPSRITDTLLRALIKW